MLFSQGPDKDFLVPDSCRVNSKKINCNSISANITEDAIENN